MGRLILERRCGEKVVINGNIYVSAMPKNPEHRNCTLRICIEAPKKVSVHREEIQQRIHDRIPRHTKG
jgi:carbon storage regulator CsrA